MATIYVPVLQPIFQTQALSLSELALCLGASVIVFVAVEVEKWLTRRGWLYATPKVTPRGSGTMAAVGGQAP
jgi:Ca2+-transporting ATPase